MIFLVTAPAKTGPSLANAILVLQNIYFAIFAKTKVVPITFRLTWIHGESLKEIDFSTRNAADRFYRDCLLKVIVF